VCKLLISCSNELLHSTLIDAKVHIQQPVPVQHCCCLLQAPYGCNTTAAQDEMHLNANTWHFAQDLHLANGLKHVAVSAPMMQLLLVYVCKKNSVTGWRFINLLRDTTYSCKTRYGFSSKRPPC
jgi:hypothetical protein